MATITCRLRHQFCFAKIDCGIRGLQLLMIVVALTVWHHWMVVFLQELLELESRSTLLLVPIILEDRLLLDLLGL